MKYISYIYILFSLNASYAQIKLEPSLYSNMGSSVSFQGWQMDFSIGEPVVNTASANGVTLTQGFHQPIDSFYLFNNQRLNVSYISVNTCRGKSSGSIVVNVSGGFPSYTIIWNDYTLDSTTFVRDSLPIGTYVATITDQEGVQKSITVDITETDNCLKIYSGITPNGDGANDYWFIGNIDFFPDNEVQLYSRWGNMVWETKKYNNLDNYWTGTDKNGNRLPDGTYFYIINNVGPKTEKGWVELTGDVRGN